MRTIPLIDVSTAANTTREIEKACRDNYRGYIPAGFFSANSGNGIADNGESVGFGIHPHKDTDALTILAPDPVGGLMIRCRDEQEWISAEPPGDALTVNIGDLLELWSGGYFVSTPHKVVNTSGAERYSFPYVVKPLKTRQNDFRRPSVHVGDVSKEVWRTNWPDAKSDKSHFDLGTLED